MPSKRIKDKNGDIIRWAKPEEARDIFKRYIALLYRLVVQEKNKFDLIIGAGDSGAAMAGLAKIFYKKFRLKAPRTTTIPIQRFTKPGDESSGYFDNSILIPQIKKDLKGIKSIKSVLFVDDEIWKAWSAKTSIELVLQSLPKRKIPKRLLYTIVAENHGFEWHYDVNPVAIRYYAFSKKNSRRKRRDF